MEKENARDSSSTCMLVHKLSRSTRDLSGWMKTAEGDDRRLFEVGTYKTKPQVACSQVFTATSLEVCRKKQSLARCGCFRE